jgi:hypothetical protein
VPASLIHTRVTELHLVCRKAPGGLAALHWSR